MLNILLLLEEVAVVLNVEVAVVLEVCVLAHSL